MTNNGTGIGTQVVITDMVPAFTAYKPGTIKTGSSEATLTARTDDADGDGATYDAGSNAVVVGSMGGVNLGPSGTLVLQFKVVIQ